MKFAVVVRVGVEVMGKWGRGEQLVPFSREISLHRTGLVPAKVGCYKCVPGWGVQLRWQRACPACTGPQVPSPAQQKQAMLAQIYNLNIWKVKVGGFGVQDHP